MGLLNNVVPVLILVAAGWLVRRPLNLDARLFARFTLLVLLPAMIFHSILRGAVAAGEVARIAAFAILSTLVLTGVTVLVNRLWRWGPDVESALLLATVFSNAVNYGFPIIYFAWGQPGLDRAVIFGICQGLLMSTAGVYIASRGKVGWRQALRPAATNPLFLATLVGFTWRATGLTLPDALARPVELAAGAAIPMLLLVLGLQLADTRLQGAKVQVATAALLRLLVAPAVAWAVTLVVGVEPLTARVLTLQLAAPTAVVTTLLAIEYGCRPDLVASVTLTTTVLSLFTVPGLLWLLH